MEYKPMSQLSHYGGTFAGICTHQLQSVCSWEGGLTSLSTSGLLGVARMTFCYPVKPKHSLKSALGRSELIMVQVIWVKFQQHLLQMAYKGLLLSLHLPNLPLVARCLSFFLHTMFTPSGRTLILCDVLFWSMLL